MIFQPVSSLELGQPYIFTFTHSIDTLQGFRIKSFTNTKNKLWCRWKPRLLWSSKNKTPCKINLKITAKYLPLLWNNGIIEGSSSPLRQWLHGFYLKQWVNRRPRFCRHIANIAHCGIWQISDLAFLLTLLKVIWNAIF